MDFDESISNQFNKIRSTDYKTIKITFILIIKNSSLKSLKIIERLIWNIKTIKIILYKVEGSEKIGMGHVFRSFI